MRSIKRFLSMWFISMYIANSRYLHLLSASFLAIAILAGCATTDNNIKGNTGVLTDSEAQAIHSALTAPRRLAIVIGINEFDDIKWNPLRYAEKDAEDFSSILNDHRYGQFDQVISLTGPEQTTRENILAAVRELERQNISEQDTVILYLSSHGTIARTNDGKLHQYVVAKDSLFGDIPNTAIDLDILKSRFNQLRSRKKALIFAFCHSGSGKSRLDDAMLADLNEIKSAFFVKPIEIASEATIVLSASAWGETARENKLLQNDIYTHFLIEGIKKHDRNNDGAVTITEAHDYAREQTYYISKGEQRPSMESVITGADPIILSGEIIRTGKPVLYDYSKRYEDLVMFVDGEKKGTLPLGVALEPGRHNVEIRSIDGTQRLYHESFSVNEGDQVSLPLLLNGYDKGTSLRIGYQGFLTDEVDNRIAKPMTVFGIAYADHASFGPRLGYRADIAYGKDEQMLNLGLGKSAADVTQTSAGIALIYRMSIGKSAIYGGPRLGELIVKRKFLNSASSEQDMSTVIGGIIGVHYKYKEKLSLAIEGTINYTKLELFDINTDSYYYNLIGGLSINF